MIETSISARMASYTIQHMMLAVFIFEIFENKNKMK